MLAPAKVSALPAKSLRAIAAAEKVDTVNSSAPGPLPRRMASPTPTAPRRSALVVTVPLFCVTPTLPSSVLMTRSGCAVAPARCSASSVSVSVSQSKGSEACTWKSSPAISTMSPRFSAPVRSTLVATLREPLATVTVASSCSLVVGPWKSNESCHVLPRALSALVVTVTISDAAPATPCSCSVLHTAKLAAASAPAKASQPLPPSLSTTASCSCGPLTSGPSKPTV